MGKVESIKRAADAPAASAPAPRTPEREKLAAAIERHANALADMANIEVAKRRVNELGMAADDAVSIATTALADARASAPRKLVNRLLAGEGPSGADEVQDAQGALTRAESDARNAQEAQRLLDGEIQSARREVEWSGSLLREARGRAIAADPAVAELIAAHEVARRHIADLAGALHEIASAFGIPEFAKSWDSIPATAFPSPSVPAWRAAIERLRSDADAPLPAVTVTVERTIVDPGAA